MRIIHEIGFFIWRAGCGMERIGNRLLMVGRRRVNEHDLARWDSE